MKSLSRKSLQVFRPLLSRPRCWLARTQNPVMAPENQAFIEKLSIHRTRVNLYDLVPQGHEGWVAPNATVSKEGLDLVGQVIIGAGSTVWFNSVIRGDLNEVTIGKHSSIGEHTVIHTAASLPNGRTADADIGSHVIIQNNCSIYSCIIEDDVLIGSKSVLLEGCHIAKGAVVLPNSVVPPGRYVPSNQIWGGNPVEYIRDLDMSEQFANYSASYIAQTLADQIDSTFQVWSSTYLKKETTKEDAEFDNSESVEGCQENTPRSHPEL